MWRGQKDWSVANEAEFNRLSSVEQPYCSICCLFHDPTSRNGLASSSSAAKAHSQPTSSAVLVPEEVFTRSPVQQQQVRIKSFVFQFSLAL